jgi:predicted dehydrogenase
MIGFRAIPDVEVTALCDLHEGLLKEQAEKFNIPRTYRIYEDMLESDIDAVVVSTPMQLHVQQTIQALEAGKHVMCEVTAGVTMDELWWLKEAVEKHSDKVFMFAENYCYIPTNQLIANMVNQGMFGEIYFGEGEYIHDIKHLAYGFNRRVPGEQAASNKTSWRNYWQFGKRGIFYRRTAWDLLCNGSRATGSSQSRRSRPDGIPLRSSVRKTRRSRCASWKAAS